MGRKCGSKVEHFPGKCKEKGEEEKWGTKRVSWGLFAQSEYINKKNFLD